MLAERDIRGDLLALGLLVAFSFLGLALTSYDPADPSIQLVHPLNQWYRPDQVVFPQHAVATNVCGPWGASIATVLLEAIGIGAYFAVISLGAVTVLLLMRRRIDSPIARTLGWTAALVGFCTLCDMLIPWMTPGPVIGSGGYLGALAGGILRIHFAQIGGFVIAASTFFGGLLLCTDYVLVHLGLVLGSLTLTGLARGRSWKPRKSAAKSPVESANPEMSVKVGGRKIRLAPVPASDEEDDEEEENAEAIDSPVIAAKIHALATAEEDEDAIDDDELEDEVDETDVEPDVEEAPRAPRTSLLRASRGRRRLSASANGENRDDVRQQLDEAADQDQGTPYELPSLELLQESDAFPFDEQAREVHRKAKLIEKTFKSFGFNVKVVEIETGPVIAQYEVELESGLRLSKITSLADDLAIALRVPSVRIVAPIPGKNTVGIEVPNERRQLVRLRDVMQETEEKLKEMRIPIFLGKDVSGNPMAVDLSAMPHLLIAGRTGTGKSVCLNAIITSILMTRRPDEVKMLMIDPKMVELSGYRSLPHLMHPVVTDMRKAEAILAWAVDKMEERYALLARAGVRHISGYNQLSQEVIHERLAPETDEERSAIPLHMPYIVIVADEIADLMMTSGKEVEQHIIRLAQKSRAVGIHLILATQKPTVDVITGLIKSNLPARIAFQVASRTDSRVVLDEMGADKLLGNGDMLFLWPGTSTLIRGQGTYLSDEEINQVVAAVSTGEQHFANELVELKVTSDRGDTEGGGDWRSRDEVYEEAIEIVIREGRGSVSLLQRHLGIGYGRAARIIDYMAEDGIVGTYNGSQAREVIMSLADWEQMKQGGVSGRSDESGETFRGDPPATTAGSKASSRKRKGAIKSLKVSANRNARKGPRLEPVDVDEDDMDEDVDEADDDEGDRDDEVDIDADDESAAGSAAHDDRLDADGESDDDFGVDFDQEQAALDDEDTPWHTSSARTFGIVADEE